MGAWFMWIQVVTCLIGCGGYIYQKQYAQAWVWLCYSLANLGFVKMAGGF